MKLLTKILAFVGTIAAVFGTFGCIALIADEAEMPNSLLNR